MKILKNTLASLLILTTLSTAGTFEQNGVKEGNNRVSGSATLNFLDSGNKKLLFIGQFGHFLTNNIEITTTLMTNTISDDTNSSLGTYTDYLIGVGANYYFAKTPTLTPYIGSQYYYGNSTRDGDFTANRANIHIGAHQFLSENFAITPEAGSSFYDFKDYYQSYLNVYLTYFFD